MDWPRQLSNYERYLIYSTGKIFDIFLGRYVSQQNIGGYLQVSLQGTNGKRKSLKVHRLVAKVFLLNPQHKKEVNHKDGDKMNNDVSNLEWCTHSENIRHAWETGLLTNTSQRSKKLILAHKGRKPKHSQVPVRLINTGEVFESMKIASLTYKVDGSCISNCCRGVYKIGGKDPLTKEPLIWEYA